MDRIRGQLSPAVTPDSCLDGQALDRLRLDQLGIYSIGCGLGSRLRPVCDAVLATFAQLEACFVSMTGGDAILEGQADGRQRVYPKENSSFGHTDLWIEIAEIAGMLKLTGEMASRVKLGSDVNDDIRHQLDSIRAQLRSQRTIYS